MNTKSIILPLAELSPRGNTISCSNLTVTPHTIDGMTRLTTASGLSVLILDPLTPLAATTLPDGTDAILLYSKTDNLKMPVFVCTRSRLTRIGAVEGEPYCAVPDSDGWLMMTPAGQVSIKYSSGAELEWTITAPSSTPPDISLTTNPRGEISQQITSLTLTDVDFSRDNSAIGSAGLKALTSALLEAYCTLSARAAESGTWIQPLLARFHLLNGDGKRLLSSSPQLLGHGWQCCDTLQWECTKRDDSLVTPSSQLSASMFSIMLSVGSLGAFAGVAKSIEVTLTPQIHPIDLSAQAVARLVRPSTSTPGLSVALPGATASLASNIALLNSRIVALLPAVERVETSVPVPTATNGAEFSIGNPLQRSVATEISAVTSALLKTSTTSASHVSPSLIGQISPPHSFIARTATSSGDKVAWADITPLPALPPLPRQAAATEPCETEWTGSVMVTMASGAKLLTPIGYPMALPSSLPPLVVYPDPKAVQLDLWVENIDNGTVSHASVSLSSLSDGSGAFHLAPSLSPVELSPWENADFPRARTSGLALGLRQCGAVVCAATSNPGTPLSATVITQSPVVALQPAVKSQSSWDFTRTYLYAFSPEGIFAVAFGGKNSTPASSLIASHPVKSPSSVCRTDSGVAALSSSGLLLMVTASRVRTVLSGLSASSLAWHAPTNRIWALIPDGSIRCIDADTGNSTFLRPTASVERLHSVAGHLFARTPDALLHPVDSPTATTAIEWASRVPLHKSLRAQALVVEMSASHFSGTISLRTDSGTGSANSLPLVTLSIDGPVNAPVIVRLNSRLSGFVTLSISGDASADFSLTHFKIIHS